MHIWNVMDHDVHSTQNKVPMHNASLFVPDTISDSLRLNLAIGLRALADALDAQKLRREVRQRECSSWRPIR